MAGLSSGVFGFVCLVVVTEQKTADELQEHAEDLFRRVQQLKEHL